MITHWRGREFEGARVTYNDEHWMIWNWNPKTRDLTLINATGTTVLNDPYCMQWEK